MSRNPFLSGLMGGMLGAGLIGMMFGGGFGAGLAGMAGMLGLLLQLALIGGLAYLAVRLWLAAVALLLGQPLRAAYAGNAPGGNPLSREALPEATADGPLFRPADGWAAVLPVARRSLGPQLRHRRAGLQRLRGAADERAGRL